MANEYRDGFPRNDDVNYVMLASTPAGTDVLKGGFLRRTDANDALRITSIATGAVMDRGFLRAPDGALVAVLDPLPASTYLRGGFQRIDVDTGGGVFLPALAWTATTTVDDVVRNGFRRSPDYYLVLG